MSEIQVGQINSTDGSTAITTGADGYVSFAKTQMGGRKNIILNGSMQVAQRGTSTTGVTSTDGYYACDRWRTQTDINTWTISQATDAPDGFNNSFKLACTSGSQVPHADEISIRYHIEGQDLQGLAYGTSSAKSFTVSFWVKCSVTGTYTLSCRNLNSSQERMASFNYTVDVADTWEYKTITFTGDTSYAFENVNTTGLQMFWWFSAASAFKSGAVSNTWQNYSAGNHADSSLADFGANGDSVQITGVQLEVGTIATPFEHRSYGEELALCQRYYQLIQEGAGSRDNQGSISVPGEQLIGIGFCLDSNRVMGGYRYPHPMRAIPSSTVSFSSNIAVLRPTGAPGGWSTATTVNIRATDKYARFDINGVSVTAGNACEIRIEASTGGKIEFDAEL